MKQSLRLPLCASLLLMCFVTGTARAQAPAPGGDAATEADPTPSLASSVTVGYLSTDFTYAGEDTTTAYDFSGPLAALVLGGQRGSLALSYGQADSTGARPSLRTLGAALWTGGDLYLFRNLFGVPLAVFVPIRFNADYRYTWLSQRGTAPDTTVTPALHLVGSGLGAGAGARFAFPAGPSFVKDNLVAQASLVFAPGVIGNLGKGFDAENALERPFDELKMRWATDFNVEVQFKRLLGGRAGVAAGYTLRAVSRSPEKPGGLGDVLDAFVDRSDFAEVIDQHVFRVGITW